MHDKPLTKQETSLRDFLDVVFRRKWVILSVFAIATALVGILDARRPDLWESSSRVLVRRGEQGTLLNPTVRTLGWAEEVASEIQVILSDDVFTRARRAFTDSVEAGGLPADWTFNPGSVRADVIGESNVFVISYADVRRDVCTLGCNSVTLAFREYYRERKAPPVLTDFFVGELADTRAQLEVWRARRNEFLNQENFYGTEETSRFLLSKIGMLEQRLTQLNGDVTSQNLRVDNLAGLVQKTGPELESELAFTMSQNVLQSTIVQNIKFSLQQLNLRREELAQKYTEHHPELLSVNQQIADLHADLKKQVENAYSIEKVTLSEMTARRASVLEELNGARAELDAVPDLERKLTEMDEMIKTLAGKLEMLEQRRGEAEIARAGHPEQEVSILQHASAPYSKKTRDYVRLALGPLLSIIVGLGIAFFLESMDHSVKSRAEAEEFLGVPVLTVVTESSARAHRAATGGGG
jgi:uncharacterized protein involved in exopolysaccharide biosynthesis